MVAAHSRPRELIRWRTAGKVSTRMSTRHARVRAPRQTRSPDGRGSFTATRIDPLANSRKGVDTSVNTARKSARAPPNALPDDASLTAPKICVVKPIPGRAHSIQRITDVTSQGRERISHDLSISRIDGLVRATRGIWVWSDGRRGQAGAEGEKLGRPAHSRWPSRFSGRLDQRDADANGASGAVQGQSDPDRCGSGRL